MLRRFVIAFGVFLIGIPIAFVIANWAAYSGSSIGGLVFFFFLASWLVMSSLWTRSAKTVYWCLQLVIWVISIGILSSVMSLYMYESNFLWIWLPLPVGLSIILAALYKKAILFLSNLPFLRQPVFRPTRPPYQQGYRASQQPKAVYEESIPYYPYPDQEQPQAQYPPTMTQQQ